MNKAIGIIIGAGLLWFGTQQVSMAQSITIEIGDSQRNVDIRGNSISRQEYEPHNGVVYKPSTRLHGGVVYHGISPNPRYGISPAPVYRENVVIYSDRDDDRNYYNQSERYRYNRRYYGDGSVRERVYYWRDRYFGY
jgi:hypothetical protein